MRYKVLYYISDHFSENSTYAIGALIQMKDGKVVPVRISNVIVNLTPPAYILYKHLVNDIGKLASFDKLPISFGPHCVMSEARPIPDLSPHEDPIAYVKSAIIHDDGGGWGW